jgi:murein DD-endopeptidase MepM/ murein hydrolase activator NlpD
LAQQYSVSVAALKQWNSLRNNLIKVGQTLQVSAGQPLISRSGTSTSYQLLWPVIGTVSSGWGYRTRFEKFHYGLDIAAPTGTPIYAACAGVVEYAGWKNGYGYCVFLDHGNGLKTAYGHASKLYVKRGQSVEAGQRIAAVGSTGFSTGPHVHLEVRINGRLVNPATVLPKTR